MGFSWIISIITNPEWVVAIATFLAVLAALFKDVFINWRNKPNIIFGLSNKKPHVLQIVENGIVMNYFRLKIINKGRTVAKNCNIKIISVVLENTNSSIIEQDKLKWSNAPLDTRYRHDIFINSDISQLVPIHKEYMNIPPNRGWEFCDFFKITTGNNLMFLSSTGIHPSFLNENYIVTIEISGENLKPKKAKIRIFNPTSFEHIKIGWA